MSPVGKDGPSLKSLVWSGLAKKLAMLGEAKIPMLAKLNAFGVVRMGLFGLRLTYNFANSAY